MKKLLALLLLLCGQAEAQLFPGVLRESIYPTPTNSWTCTSIGSNTCDCSTQTATSVTVVATDTSSRDDACFAYQTVSSGDIQLFYRVVDAGSADTNGATVAGAIRAGTNVGDPDIRLEKRWEDQAHEGKYRVSPSGSTVTGIFGDAAFTIPVWGGLQYDDSADTLNLWESNDVAPVEGTDFTEIASGLSMSSGFPHPLPTGFLVWANPSATGPVTAEITGIDLSGTFTLGGGSSEARSIAKSMALETGQFQPHGQSEDGAFILTLPEPQSGSETRNTGQGGCGPTSDCDFRVVTAWTTPSNPNGAGDSITPRNGSYFLRGSIYRDKDYSNVANGTPRAQGSCVSLSECQADFDKEIWFGFSMFIPDNYEDETGPSFEAGTERNLGGINATASRSQLSLGIRTIGGVSKIILKYWVNDAAVTENAFIQVELGDVEDHDGLWTDLIFQVRFNPCGGPAACDFVAQGIANAQAGTFQPLQGILRVWMSDENDQTMDGNNNRDMVQVIERNLVQQGLVPGDRDLRISPYKLYPFGFQDNPTSTNGEIHIAFDEFRWGYAVENGTGYSDVHPTQQAQP